MFYVLDGLLLIPVVIFAGIFVIGIFLIPYVIAKLFLGMSLLRGSTIALILVPFESLFYIHLFWKVFLGDSFYSFFYIFIMDHCAFILSIIALAEIVVSRYRDKIQYQKTHSGIGS